MTTENDPGESIDKIVKLSIDQLKNVEEKAVEYLNRKKIKKNELYPLIDELVDSINASVILTHETDFQRRIPVSAVKELLHQHQALMQIAVKVFEEQNKLSPITSEISVSAKVPSKFDVNDRYYFFVKDYYNHKIETDPEKVQKMLIKQINLAPAMPSAIMTQLLAAGRRLDPRLHLSPLLKNVQEQYYGGLQPVDKPIIESGMLGDQEWAVSTFNNSHCREQQEDTHFIGAFELIHPDAPNCHIRLYGVYDGHGGKKCSDFLSKYLHKHVVRKLNNSQSLTDLHIFNALKLAFVDANEQFELIGDESGSTGIVALFLHQDLWIANIGDTRAVLCKNGIPIQLSEDQKPSSSNIRAGIYKRGGRVEQGRIVMGPISLGPGRAIGDKEIKGLNPRPKVTKFDLRNLVPNSWLILACDGLWDVVGSGEVSSIIDNAATAAEAATRLQNEAINRWTYDNVTIMVIKLC